MKIANIQPHKSSLGMDANVAALIVYIAMVVVLWLPYAKFLAWAVPLVFFFLEKQSKFVKFHAVQALVVGVAGSAVLLVLNIFSWIILAVSRGLGVWMLLGTISTIIGLAFTVLVVYLAVMAFTYKQVDLPVLGPIAAKAGDKLDTMNPPGNPPGSDNQ